MCEKMIESMLNASLYIEQGTWSRQLVMQGGEGVEPVYLTQAKLNQANTSVV